MKRKILWNSYLQPQKEVSNQYVELFIKSSHKNPPNGNQKTCKLFFFSYDFYILFYPFWYYEKLFFFPAAEVAKQDENNQYGRDLLVPTTTSTAAKLPSPMLSPSFSSDEDSVYSPNTIVNQDFQLDDLFDWDGQQQVVNTIGNDTF